MTEVAFHDTWRDYCSTAGPRCVRWGVLQLVAWAVVVGVVWVLRREPSVIERVRLWWWAVVIAWHKDDEGGT